MRKQYKKARYKRAALREADRKYPGIKALRRNLEKARKAIEELGRSIAEGLNKLIGGVMVEDLYEGRNNHRI